MSRFLKYGTIISTYLLIGSVLLQIFARFFLTNTPSWTEEASRLFFIYAMAFSAGLALKGNYYVYLDLIFNKLSKRHQKALLIFIYLIVVTLFVLMSFGAIQFSILGLPESSPSMKVSMAIGFSSMFIMAGSLVYYSIVDLLNILNKPL